MRPFLNAGNYDIYYCYIIGFGSFIYYPLCFRRTHSF